MSRIWNESRTIGSVNKQASMTYFAGGSVKTETYPSGAVLTYTIGGAGRALSATDTTHSINYASGATYTPPGGLASLMLGTSSGFAGITESNTYNNRLQPLLLTANAPSGTLMSLSYNFNLGSGDNGNVITITNNKTTSRSQSFQYDTLNRLKQAISGSTWGVAFTYDQWGNLYQTSQVSGAGANPMSVNQSVDGNNRFQLSSYGYDAAGNVTSDGLAMGCSTVGYSWNAEEMTSCANGVMYTYDGDEGRVKKSSGTLYWGGEEGAALAESDASGNITSEYVFFNGKRIARRDSSGSVYYYISDHLGSSNVITNATGAIQNESDFYPFGGERAITSGISNHYKFTGKERDTESGNDYFGARYYASTMGRMLSPDPGNIGADPSNPQSWNMYSYGLNNPLSNTDPSGLYVCEDSTECNSQNDKNFGNALSSARASLNASSLSGEDLLNAKNALDAYGKARVDNGVNVRFDANLSTAGVTEVSGVANGNKSADNPNGQNINVTFNPASLGKEGSGSLIAHEGSHVSDGSNWVKSGFSASMNPTHNQTEMKANHVQFDIFNQQLMNLDFPQLYTASLYGRSVNWQTGDTFKQITPDLQKAIQKMNGSWDTKPAFTKGARLQP